MRKISLISALIIFSINSFAFATETNNVSEKNTKHLLLANAPPGLQKKGFSGIPSNGKTPPGWNQGVKRGWNKDKNWRWNNETHLWENEHWKWNSRSDKWETNHDWKKH